MKFATIRNNKKTKIKLRSWARNFNTLLLMNWKIYIGPVFSVAHTHCIKSSFAITTRSFIIHSIPFLRRPAVNNVLNILRIYAPYFELNIHMPIRHMHRGGRFVFNAN